MTNLSSTTPMNNTRGRSELVVEGDSECLIVCFGGAAQLFGGSPPFEFLRFLTSTFPNRSAIFYTDERIAYYSEGFKGITKNHEENVKHLKKRIEGYKRVMMVGTSMGGYAAILYGSLCKVDKVVAFGPQTKTNKGDYNDLLDILDTNVQYELYTLPDDGGLHSHEHVKRVERLKLPNVKCFIGSPHPKVLRNSGKLKEILM